MNLFFAIIFGIPIVNLIFGWWAHRKLRGRKWLRLANFIFVALQFVLYLWFISARMIHVSFPLPGVLAAGMYIWNLIVLPAAIIAIILGELIRGAVTLIRKLAALRQQKTEAAQTVDAPLVTGLSRRSFLAASAAVLPPLIAIGGVGVGIAQFHNIRIRRFELASPVLPANLDGLTIVHLSDLHIGRFVDEKLIRQVTTMTNALRPDLICFTGDLIDFAISDLSAGLDMFKRMDPRLGLAVCEGNHDLFESASEFARQTKAAGVQLLGDESLIIPYRNERIQLLGMRWGRADRPRELDLEEHAVATLAHLREGAFPILLAHHPHAFDAASILDVPLTLAGHTHGGQLMLTPNIGPGPMFYKYWSGLYRRKESSLIVSNGVGNWFPLRINAPAEIVHVTLRTSAKD